jgi:hypothetical protein
MKNMSIIITVLCVVLACNKPSPGSSDPVDCSGPAKSFANDVNPVIELMCGACHGRGSTNGPGELSSYSQIFNARIVIRGAVISGQMPQGGSLTAAQKNAIICWIDNGAPNN